MAVLGCRSLMLVIIIDEPFTQWTIWVRNALGIQDDNKPTSLKSSLKYFAILYPQPHSNKQNIKYSGSHEIKFTDLAGKTWMNHVFHC